MSKLILIKNFPNRLTAEMAQQTLDAEGIPSIVKAPDYGISGSGTGGSYNIFTGQGVDLYVEEKYSSKADEIIRTTYNGI